MTTLEELLLLFDTIVSEAVNGARSPEAEECFKRGLAMALGANLSARPQHDRTAWMFEPGGQFKHVKTGGLYRTIARALREDDGLPLVIYRSEDTGETWARPAEAFFDGRFVRTPAEADAHLSAEKPDGEQLPNELIPLGSIFNGRACADRLEAVDYDCDGGTLTQCSYWVEFRECFENLAQWVQGFAKAAKPAVRQDDRKALAEADHWAQDKVKIQSAIRNAGLTLVRGEFGYRLERFGPIVAAAAADSKMPVEECKRLVREAVASQQESGHGQGRDVIDAVSKACDAIDRLASLPQPAAAVPSGVTDEMVRAYLTANDAYWKRIDANPTTIGRWRNGTPSEATRVALAAALAAAPALPAAEPAPPYSAPFTTDVPQCCGDPETCSDPCAPSQHLGKMVVKEFTNELGNAIRITVEGPASMHENVVTPMEASKLREALNEFAAQPTPPAPQADALSRALVLLREFGVNETYGDYRLREVYKLLSTTTPQETGQ